MVEQDDFEVEVRWIEAQSGIAKARLLPVSSIHSTLEAAVGQWRNLPEAQPIAAWLGEPDWTAIGLNGKRARPEMKITALDRIDFTLPLRQEAMALRRQRATLYKTQKRRAAQ
jgi:hypothetical protein